MAEHTPPLQEEPQSSAAQYDRALQLTFKTHGRLLLDKLFGIQTRGPVESLDVMLQAPTVRYADCVYQYVDRQTGQTTVFQLELQSRPDPEMDERMLIYHSLLVQRFRKTGCRLRQAVLYATGGPDLKEGYIQTDHVDYSYPAYLVEHLLSIDWVLQQTDPELLLLGVLAHFPEPEKTTDYLRRLMLRLRELAPAEELFRKYMLGLRELSGLRKLERTVFNLQQTMPITIDPEQSLLYQEGLEAGKEQGKQEGIQLGKQEGIQLGKQEGIQLGKQEGIQLGKEEGIQLGKQEGIQQGKQEGIQQGKQEGIQLGQEVQARRIARQLLREGLDRAIVARTTGLSAAALEALLESDDPEL